MSSRTDFDLRASRKKQIPPLNAVDEEDYYDHECPFDNINCEYYRSVRTAVDDSDEFCLCGNADYCPEVIREVEEDVQ